MTILMLKYNQYRILTQKGVKVMLKIQEIREIIRLIDESSINEFSYENEGASVTIKKENTNAQTKVVEVETTPAPAQKVQVETPSQPVVETKATETEPRPSEYDNLVGISSPIVGTFYSKPSPESDDYVKVGDKVSADSVVCIVEAMKLFNEIEAEQTGEIVEILVKDGELVEYGQALFKVKP